MCNANLLQLFRFVLWRWHFLSRSMTNGQTLTTTVIASRHVAVRHLTEPSKRHTPRWLSQRHHPSLAERRTNGIYWQALQTAGALHLSSKNIRAHLLHHLWASCNKLQYRNRVVQLATKLAALYRTGTFILFLLLLLPLQPTVGFSLLNDPLPFCSFFTLLSPPSYSHYLQIFFNACNPSLPWSPSSSRTCRFPL